jgi:hypothetical protein
MSSFLTDLGLAQVIPTALNQPRLEALAGCLAAGTVPYQLFFTYLPSALAPYPGISQYFLLWAISTGSHKENRFCSLYVAEGALPVVARSYPEGPWLARFDVYTHGAPLFWNSLGSDTRSAFPLAYEASHALAKKDGLRIAQWFDAVLDI